MKKYNIPKAEIISIAVEEGLMDGEPFVDGSFSTDHVDDDP